LIDGDDLNYNYMTVFDDEIIDVLVQLILLCKMFLGLSLKS